jgi:hypothetical protein
MDEFVQLFFIQEWIVDNHVKVCIFHYLVMRMKVVNTYTKIKLMYELVTIELVPNY